jgi:hypothetical protein
MIEKTNIADLRTPDGGRLTPRWFDLDNYDLAPDWAQEREGAKMSTSRPDDETGETPLDFA